MSTKRPRDMSQNTILFIPTIQMMTVLVMNMIIIIRMIIQIQNQLRLTITYDKAKLPHIWVLRHLLFHGPERKGTYVPQARRVLLLMIKVFPLVRHKWRIRILYGFWTLKWRWLIRYYVLQALLHLISRGSQHLRSHHAWRFIYLLAHYFFQYVFL